MYYIWFTTWWCVSEVKCILNKIIAFLCYITVKRHEVTKWCLLFIQNVLAIQLHDEDSTTSDDHISTVLFDLGNLRVGEKETRVFGLKDEVKHQKDSEFSLIFFGIFPTVRETNCQFQNLLWCRDSEIQRAVFLKVSWIFAATVWKATHYKHFI